jgi:hypothetical protein
MFKLRYVYNTLYIKILLFFIIIRIMSENDDFSFENSNYQMIS